MHYCAVIVHNKSLEVVEAREIVGDTLVARGEADWFSIDDYRQRTFDGKVSIPFGEFLKIKDFFSVDNPLVFATIEDGYIEYLQIPKSFYELHRDTGRDHIVSLYEQAYYETQIRILEDLSKYDNVDDLIVTLLDYHN